MTVSAALPRASLSESIHHRHGSTRQGPTSLPDRTFRLTAPGRRNSSGLRNHAQVIDGGWSADYPSADTFIGKLACTYFAPGNGPATSDGSEFCDPAVDRQITRAAALQATDPQAAAAWWAQLDRQLTNRAVFLPTVTPNEVDLLSRRAGNFQYNPVWGALIDQLWVR